MKISERGINLIQSFEGFYPKEYACPSGYPTIGFGTVIKHGAYPEGVTKEQATGMMMAEINRIERSVNRLIAVEINQNQFDALCSFCYNLGSGALQASTLRSLINRGDFIAAAEEFPKWCHAGGRKLAGLVRRRWAEREMFLS